MSEEVLFEVMTNLGESMNSKRLNELIAEADFDGDGKISYDDFFQVMKAK